MKRNRHVLFTSALLSVAIFSGLNSPVIAQDSPVTTGEPRPGPTIPGNRDSAIQEAAQSNQNDNCVEDASSEAGAREELGTDARIDSSRLNCLDEHYDAPHEDNLRVGSPAAPSERTDLIIDEDQRNSANGD